MSKLAAGDMVVIDAKYHIKCLTQLYRRAAKLHRDTSEDTAELALKGIAFAELVAYIEMYRDNITLMWRPCSFPEWLQSYDEISSIWIKHLMEHFLVLAKRMLYPALSKHLSAC